ncbi:MAG: glycosyltransferase family 4 protein [Patescibacteria group bacterium]|jgi:glycosyltransferase involved in cell wall biosynthesis
MKKIKVLFTVGNLNIGGAEKLVINQIKNIDKNRFEPHLCTLFPTDKNNYSKIFSDLSGVVYHQFLFKGPWDIINWAKVFLLLRREKFDILCCHLFESNFIIRLLNIFIGVKSVFIFEHNIYWQKQWWKISADRWLAKKTTKIFVDSQAILDFTSKQEKINKEKFAILPYPIELAEHKKIDPAELKKDLNLPKNSFIIGTVARFVKQKGLVYLIKAAAQVLQDADRSDVYFLIVGYGPMEAELEKLIDDLDIKPRVIISSARDIKDVLTILDIYAISSLWEGQPIAMLEAMAGGCPVVATKVGGIPEIIIDGQNGLLAESENENSLAKKISQLIKDDDLRIRVTQAGKQTTGKYGLSIYIKKLEEYFITEYKLKNRH